LHGSCLSDIGIIIELIGFVVLIIRQISIGRQLKKRDRTLGLYNAMLPGAFIIVILGLVFQHSWFQEFNNICHVSFYELFDPIYNNMINLIENINGIINATRLS